MKYLLVVCLVIFGACCAVSWLPPTAATMEEAQKYFKADEIQRGREYSQERRLIAWISSAFHLAWLLVLVFTPLGRRLADLSLRVTRGWWLPAVWLVGFVYWAVDWLISLPFGVARWMVEDQWGMTRQTLTQWFADLRLSLLVDMGTSALILTGLYTMIALLYWLFPRRWWIAAWLGAWAAGTVLSVLIAYFLPVLIEPLYNTFTPLSQTKWKDQEPNLRELVAKGGVEIGDILVVDASRRSGHTNAYFTGFGSTRRIVLYDTLLEQHVPAEVESILAHEMGHWLHNHIVIGLAWLALASFGGLFVLFWFWQWVIGKPPLYLRSPIDSASIPLLVLLVWLGTWLAMPLQNAVSRHFERQADAMSLKLGPPPHVFIAAEKRLARVNLSNVVTHPLAVWLYHSHPPAVERIRMGEEWGKKGSQK